MNIVTFLSDPQVCGPTVRTAAVMQRLARRGHGVTVAFPDVCGPGLDYLRERGVGVERLEIDKPVHPRRRAHFLRFLARLPRNLRRCRRWLAQRRPDIVHANGAFDIVPAFAARAAGLPLVWHLNDTAISPRLAPWFGRMVCARATCVAAAARRVGHHYGLDDADFEVLYAPVDTGRFPARSEHRPRATPRLALLGNWNPLKGHDRFVETIRLLEAEHGIAAEGVVMGRFLEVQKAWWEPIVARIEALGLSPRIRFAGYVADPAAELAGADLLLLTSRSEACPICVLEAMSVGVPVVAFDVGGIREMIDRDPDSQAGIVVAEGDCAAMAAAAFALLTDPERYLACARNGQRVAREVFPIEKCVERHERIYRRAISNRSGDR